MTFQNKFSLIFLLSRNKNFVTYNLNAFVAVNLESTFNKLKSTFAPYHSSCCTCRLVSMELMNFYLTLRHQLPSTSCKWGTFSTNNKKGDRFKLFPYPISFLYQSKIIYIFLHWYTNIEFCKTIDLHFLCKLY